MTPVSLPTSPRGQVILLLLGGAVAALCAATASRLRSFDAGPAATAQESLDSRTRSSVSTLSSVSATTSGALLYQSQCSKCHGTEGHADAEGSEHLQPPPRDFAARPWRYPVTRDSIRRVIAQGIPKTAMPASKHLTASELDRLTDHVLRLSQTSPPAPTRPPTAGEETWTTAGFTRRGVFGPAPELELTSLAGEARTLSSFRGKVTVLNFWGTNCIHCLQSFPALSQLAEKLDSENVAIVNVCADTDDVAHISKVTRRFTEQLTFYVDDAGLARFRYDANLLPTVWIMGADGQLLGRSTTAPDWSGPAVKELLGQLSKRGP